MKRLLTLTGTLALAGATWLFASGAAGGASLEKRVLFGPETAKEWSTAESTLQASMALAERATSLAALARDGGLHERGAELSGRLAPDQSSDSPRPGAGLVGMGLPPHPALRRYFAAGAAEGAGGVDPLRAGPDGRI